MAQLVDSQGRCDQDGDFPTLEDERDTHDETEQREKASNFLPPSLLWLHVFI
jgi:hypothetical protein